MGNVFDLPKNCKHVESKTDTSGRKIFIQDNKIIGFEFYGDLTNAGYMFSLMNKKTDISRFEKKLLTKYFQYPESKQLY